MNLQITQHHINEGALPDNTFVPNRTRTQRSVPPIHLGSVGIPYTQQNRGDRQHVLLRSPNRSAGFRRYVRRIPRDDIDIEPCDLNIPMPWEAL